MAITFEAFPKIARLNRNIFITEKIDGTNAQIIIDNEGNIGAASRTRLITPDDDNFGFAKWVQDNAEQLKRLGPGRHFGEWYGAGIQRGYGLTEKRFALFNAGRWYNSVNDKYFTNKEKIQFPPECCSVVPILDVHNGIHPDYIDNVMIELKTTGSKAVPGYQNPEGIVIYHSQSDTYFKRTFEHDETGKSN